ncbi:hypothetical protein AYI69_g6647, partial [Smittium culicis]
MVKFDQKACKTISSADTPELAANVAPITLPLGIGVSGPRPAFFVVYKPQQSVYNPLAIISMCGRAKVISYLFL